MGGEKGVPGAEFRVPSAEYQVPHAYCLVRQARRAAGSRKARQ